MTGFEILKLRMSCSGSSIKDEQRNEEKLILHESMSEDISANDESFFRWCAGINSHKDEQITVRLQDRKFSSANGWTVKCYSEYKDKIVVGDYFYDEYEKLYWLCTESYDLDRTQYECRLSMCNYILRFQDDFGNIYEYPYQDINSTQYGTGEFESKEFITGETSHILKLPYDDVTSNLKRNKRFFLTRTDKNPIVYKITQIDNTSLAFDGKGLIKITVSEDKYDKTKDVIVDTLYDGKYDMLCDVIYNEVEDSEITNYNKISEISYRGDKDYISGDSKKEYVAKFYNDGVEVNDVDCEWIIDEKYQKYFQIVNNSLYLKLNNDKMIGEVISVKVKDVNDEYEISEIEIEVKDCW